MTLSRVTTWANRQKLAAAALNGEFDAILAYINAGLQGTDLAYPFTLAGNVDADGNKLLNVGQYAKVRVVLPSSSIQTKIDELESSEGGGIIQLVPGTYDQDTSGITIPLGISIIGPSSYSCTISSTVAGPIVTVGDGVSATKKTTLQGFKINGASGNTKGISIANVASNGRQFTKILDVEVDGNAVSSFIGIDTNTDVVGVSVIDCPVHDCDIGIDSESSKSMLVQGCELGNDTNIKLLSCITTRILGNTFTDAADAEYHIDLEKCVSARIADNDFGGTMSTGSDIYFRSSGSTDALNNLSCAIRNNYFETTAVQAILMNGLRGGEFHGNRILDNYTGTAVAWTTASKGNVWGVNWCDARPWSGTSPMTVWTTAIDGYEEARPLGGAAGTSPTTPAFRIPVYTAAPSTSNWGVQERGRMFIVDDGAGTESLNYWNGSALVSTGDLT